jgi:GGDEF domain-containing protein
VAVLPHDARDAEGVLRAADQALYAAKDAGRNCVRSAVVVDGAV